MKTLTKTPYQLIAILFFVIVGCTSKNSDENQNEIHYVNQTIRCLDKHGYSIKYSVKYSIISKAELSTQITSEIRLKTEWVVKDFIDRQIMLDDCLLKKDSLESAMSKEVTLKNVTEFSRIDAFRIVKTAIPKRIMESILTRHGELKNANIAIY